MRDITLGETVDFKFVTTEPDTGAPATLSGTPVISAYVGNSTTQITAGITLSADFDGVTGLNNVRVAATSGNGYTDASDVALIITTGTVDSVSAVGYKVAEFTIGRAAAHTRLGAPAGASTAADIAAVKAQTAAIEADTQDLQTQVGTDGAGLTNMPWNASWDAEVQSEVADALAVYDPPTNAEMEARTLAAASYATATALQTVDDEIAVIDGNVDSILLDTAEIGAAGAGLTEAGGTGDQLTALATAANLTTVDTVVDAIKVQTDKLTFTVANQLDSNIQSINDVALTGDGQVGTEFGVA